MSFHSGALALLSPIPILSSNNWYDFSKGMKMFFLGIGMDGVISGSPPSSASELAAWKKLDRQIIAYIYTKVDPDYHYLIQDLESGQDAWKALKAHFEKSTIGHRMQARQDFYSITHDPSKPITFYIQSLTAAKRKLSALGVKIEDTEFIDVLLMHLDPSFYSIRTTILVQKDPTLEQVTTILTSSTSADLPSQSSDSVLATQRIRGRGVGFTGNGGSSGPGFGLGSGSWRRQEGRQETRQEDRHGQESGFGSSGSPVDSRGFRWCNPTNEGACHRCGRGGHIAARCMFNMPQEVKDWLMAGSPQNNYPLQQQANTAYHFLSSPIHSPNNSPPGSPIIHARSAHSFISIDSGVGPLLI
jgi:hypothetical protein